MKDDRDVITMFYEEMYHLRLKKHRTEEEQSFIDGAEELIERWMNEK